MYTCYPNRLRTDQVSISISDKCKKLTDLTGIQLRLFKVQAHGSLGIGEQYNFSLRQIYRRARLPQPSLPGKYALDVTVKATNDTMSENGLVPFRLVFGTIPPFSILNTQLPTQKERMEALKAAEIGMNSIVAELCIRAVLMHDTLSAAD